MFCRTWRILPISGIPQTSIMFIVKEKTKMTDNFDKIRPLLKFEEWGDFYFLQILQRKKDGNDVPNGSDNQRRLLKDWHIRSIEMLDEIKDEVVSICNENNARAYIRLNKRNMKTIAMAFAEETLKKVRTNQQFGSIYGEINSVIGRYPEPGKDNKTWIVDIDNTIVDSALVKNIKDIIANYCAPFDVEKIVAVIPTKSGVHLIARPFNHEAFNRMFSQLKLPAGNEVDIKKDNPTILYCP